MNIENYTYFIEIDKKKTPHVFTELNESITFLKSLRKINNDNINIFLYRKDIKNKTVEQLNL
jgi:hypothetical protein